MKNKVFYLIMVISLLAAMFNVSPVLAANAVVGTGTSASCTESAFNTALATANAGGGTITFNCGAGVTTITFTSSKSILTEDVTIDGSNKIILAGNPGVRHFIVNGGLTFTLKNITLQNGDNNDRGGSIESTGAQVVLNNAKFLNNKATNQGGAVYCYVGTGGTLTVTNSYFEGNSSKRGGAIFNDGCTANISNTTFKTNTATETGGGVHHDNSATMTMTDTIFNGNTGFDGGGFYNASGTTSTLTNVDFLSNTGSYGGGFENWGTITVNHSLIDHNTVSGVGGGVWNISGTTYLNYVTVSNNTAYEGGGINSYGDHLEINYASIENNTATGPNGGGGIYHVGGTAFIKNVSIIGNKTTDVNGSGGGIYQNSGDNLTLTNATIANNVAAYFGGGMYHKSRYAILTNVTIANNTALAGNAIYEDSPNTFLIQMTNSVIFGASNNCDGPQFDSLGNNISKGTCSSLDQPSDQNNIAGEVNLSALANNGGAHLMLTMMPLAGSPVIDAANNASCLTTDQRGLTRPVDGDGNGSVNCDIGAVEYNPTPVFSDVPKAYWGASNSESPESVCHCSLQ
ncbi:MAG TPA: choice-of-anchor Q domain-containing protein [Anaerolineales bacterium]|nr:choice-of-anchor Q domain-containing protein [Anaerolineales bacterium]